MKSPYSDFYNYPRDMMFKPKRKGCRLTKINILVVSVLGVGLLITILNIYQLRQLKEEHLYHTKDHLYSEVEGSAGKATKNSPVVWISGKHLENGYLDHVKAVFERLGFFVTNGDEEWDVLWVHDYPFIKMAKLMTRLKPHQRVNHFPGSGYITNKGSLATLQLDAFPKAFRVPKDKEKLLQYAKEHPETNWVQKNNNHRGIKIKQIGELDFESEGSFVQEFVAKPLLIDERKFDIGVYTILTSLNPLRVYIVNDESLFRFCSKNYYPFDMSDVNKYVVNDNYTPMWEMPSLKDLYANQKYSFQESFNRYMINKGKNVTKIWADIYDTIRAVYMKKQPTLMSSGAKYKTTKNFFEMVRFDFVLDEQLKVYLMEVNMSPNLATGHFRGNRRLYEHVVYNVLRVSGVASMVENHFHTSNKNLDEMLASDRETAVFSDWCTLPECYGHCENQKCSLCSYCLSSEEKLDFRRAYLEHINRGSCKRLFPPDIKREEALRWTPDHDVFELTNYNHKTRTMYMWFIGMCRKDLTFCS
ncbi:probable tubulin polyglutamylase ttll-15 [Mercenaria mercenaria]|uniref:probable tubulin polyglutamylase ttll-15 n=1 Tax=Mercenaria mercenaria TaxID=6596 RepID=UPI00234EC7F1|nr:probable tubulin polyglutamylase ttll-15 [Mercenaria mercenaria]XP_045176017.2 probable tubulin polyglutamylase ttll-15 [Mercenaria mercenaria]XP_045176025.2 probable tubulin polyglutamylase ttll-15 [Mercenaria mercenaria]XP_045176032.2 probable tubulin polyglutamylase ttll-15 [Mercenaria mercenaria]XP_045176040.2 probable tubulin polyglutamylase ttll-15 [Mercenaria mercenaria]XP_053404615.1 probable tubulin polyglutamylase ttll-15 [Mercenaria mercenaria]